MKIKHIALGAALIIAAALLYQPIADIIGNIHVNNLEADGTIDFDALTNCDTMDTDGDGTVSCGTDADTTCGAGSTGDVQYENSGCDAEAAFNYSEGDDLLAVEECRFGDGIVLANHVLYTYNDTAATGGPQDQYKVHAGTSGQQMFFDTQEPYPTTWRVQRNAGTTKEEFSIIEDQVSVGNVADDDTTLVVYGSFNSTGGGIYDGPVSLHDLLAVTATNPPAQGTPMDCMMCVITTVGSAGDSVTMPAIDAAAKPVWVINTTATAAVVFPNSGDDLGAGTNNSVALAAGDWIFCVSSAVSAWSCERQTMITS